MDDCSEAGYKRERSRPGCGPDSRAWGDDVPPWARLQNGRGGEFMGTINLTWWNLGNFFDTDDDPISRDFEYTPANGWTPQVF
jgi:hypothetical protein